MQTKTTLLAGAAFAVLALGATAASAQDTTIRYRGAPQFVNDDVSFKVRGRILLDAVFQDVDRDDRLSALDPDRKTSNVRGRQVFLGVEGTLNSQFAYKAEGGAVNGGAWSWDDVVIEYKPTENISLLAGNIKVAGLENLTSTRFTTFMDRGPYGDIGPDTYLLGGVAKWYNANSSATVAVQGTSLNSADTNNGNADDSKERLTLTGRVHYALLPNDNLKVHLGAYARYRNRGDEGQFAYAIRPNTNFGTSGLYGTTGGVADRDKTIGGEFAAVFKAFSVQAEYSNIDYTRPGANNDGNVKVGYIFATWSPTGEMRNYDASKGEFGRPKVLNPTTAGGFGGVELAVRYDYADLSDAYLGAANALPTVPNALAGEYNGVTLGVNYYPISYVRLMANYTRGEFNNPTRFQDVDVDQLQFRVQLDF